jgi:hypothetical protein
MSVSSRRRRLLKRKMTLRVLMLHWRVSRCESESLLLWIMRLDMKVQRVDIALIQYANLVA